MAFGQRGGGGGGGGGAGRDLASLFDLELDTEKNQYETAQTASPQEQHAKDVDDALAKLDALAKRQEELAQQQQNPQQSFQQRWQQEMLRREAEQLQTADGTDGAEGQQERQQGQHSAVAGRKSPQRARGPEESAQNGSGAQSGSVVSGQQACGQSCRRVAASIRCTIL